MKHWLVTLAVVGGVVLLLAADGLHSELACVNAHCEMVFIRADGGAR